MTLTCAECPLKMVQAGNLTHDLIRTKKAKTNIRQIISVAPRLGENGAAGVTPRSSQEAVAQEHAEQLPGAPSYRRNPWTPRRLL